MRTLCAAALLLTLSSSLLLAGEGRIPLWKPTVITESGKYIVTRDIGDSPTSMPPSAIVIEADDVDIDLNGFTLRAGEPVIVASGVRGLTIHNGKINSYEDAIWLDDVTHFVLRKLQIRSGEDFSVFVTGSQGTVEDCQIRHFNGGVFAAGSGIDIRRNEISGAWDGILLSECSGCKAYDNTLALGSRIRVDAASRGNMIMNNVVSGLGGWGDGITVEGWYNHVEGNLASDWAGFGLFFTQPSSQNVYRRNTVRGNGGAGCTSPPDFCNQGGGNLSRGDNFMPGPI